MSVTASGVSLEFKVTGQDEVNSALKGISSSIGEVTEAAKQQAAAEAALAKAQAEAQAREKAQVGLLKSLAGAGNQWTGALKSSAEGLGLVAEGLSKSLGIFGPWAAAAGAALGVVTALWNKLSKPEDTKPSEDQLDRLAEAYRKLGVSASLAAAEMALATEDAEKRSAAEMVKVEQQIRSLNVGIEKDERELARLEQELLDEGDSYARMVMEAAAADIVDRVNKTKGEVKALQGYIATQKKGMQAELDIQDEEAKMAKFWADREKENQEAAAKKKSDDQKAAAAAEAAAKQAMARAQQEAQQLASLRAETEKKVFEASTEDMVARTEYEYAVRKKEAEKTFSDAARRSEALELIEMQRIAAVAAAQKKADEDATKKAEEEQKKRDALSQKAAGLSVAGAAPESEVAKAEAQWDSLRAKIIVDAQKVDQTMAEYEQQYSAEELANNSEYLRLNQLRIQAAQNLADAQEQAYSRIAAAREKDMESAKEATFEQVVAAHSLTKAQKEAVAALDDGFGKMAAHADEFGAASKAVTAASMVASAIKAGADAIEYGAKSLAYFAAGNPVAGAGMAAASAGEVAAAAAYIKGIADLGGSAPSTPAASTAASGGGAQSLTGSVPSGDRDLTVNFSFEGSDHQIAGAIIRGMNLSSAQLGSQKLRKNVISTRG